MTMATPPHRINIEITSTLDSQSKDSKVCLIAMQRRRRRHLTFDVDLAKVLEHSTHAQTSFLLQKLTDSMQQSLRHTMDMPCFDTESTLHKLEANLHSMTRWEENKNSIKIYNCQLCFQLKSYLKFSIHFRWELIQVQRKTREERKLYRRAIKEKEDRMLAETGRRKLPKGQRIEDSTYNMYKHTKNKLKLIEALLSKSAGGASI